MHPLRRFQKNLDSEITTAEADKSIVRPTFSYMGDYIISDNVINSIAIHGHKKINGLIKGAKYKPKKNRTRCTYRYDSHFTIWL